MIFNIPKVIIEHIQKKKALKNEAIRTTSCWGSGFNYAARKIEKDDLEKLEKIARSEEFKVEGKKLARAIKLYKSASLGGGKLTSRNLEALVTIIVRYVVTLPRRWVFQFDEGGKNQPWLITGVTFHEAEKRKDYYIPAHTTVDLAMTRRGETKEKTLRFHRSDLAVNNLTELFKNEGYALASQDLVDQYEKDKEFYLKHRSRTGEMYLATGYAESKDSKSWAHGGAKMEVGGVRDRVVMDDQANENSDGDEDEDVTSGEETIDDDFADKYLHLEDDDETEDEAPELTEEQAAELAKEKLTVMPFCFDVQVFNLKKHAYYEMNILNLEPYVYDASMYDKLIMPAERRALIEMLMMSAKEAVADAIAGKSQGTLILNSGVPGTGKTLTAEVYAECAQRPLYVVHCAQLGIDAEELEKELKTVMQRANRWNAVLLIDEADVYIRCRGEDVNQNAIVGVFLRLLEYHTGVMFLTTNRATITDDAILSRMTAHVRYEAPQTDEERRGLWTVLGAQFGITWKEELLAAFIEAFPKLTGRSIRQLIKLAHVVSKNRGHEITVDTIRWVAQFQDVEILDNWTEKAKLPTATKAVKFQKKQTLDF